MVYGGKMIRIFISSTFNDLKQERDALHHVVFPRLRDLCNRRGIRFQPVDLRWGVSEEASHDQQTMEICLEEIHRSQSVSPRPNFVVLLGQRYGWRALPFQIPATEFETMEVYLQPDKRERLRLWYRRDDNAIPATYRLQPRTDQYIDQKVWTTTEHDLREILLTGIQHLPPGSYDPIPYFASATEQEIIRGALNVSDAGEHVHCFFRTIDGLPDDMQAKQYLDFMPDGKHDAEAAARLEDLKRRLREHLPGNIHEYQARWTDEGMTNDHLTQLCDDVFAVLAQIIEQDPEGVSAWDQQRMGNDAFGEERRRYFRGRAVVRQTIGRYLTGSDQHPLIIFGASGIGKTALMAQVVEDARRNIASALILTRFIGATIDSSNSLILMQSLCQQITQHYHINITDVQPLYRPLVEALGKTLPQYIATIPIDLAPPVEIFTRWLKKVNQDMSAALQQEMTNIFTRWLATDPAGTSPDTAGSIRLFAQRLAATLTPIPTDVEGLAKEWARRLALASAEVPLIVMIDALEQLEGEQARDLSWLPSEMPLHTRMLVTTQTNAAFTLLERRLPQTSLIKMEPLSETEGSEVLDLWLQESQRTLQPWQRDAILSKFVQNGLPLYLRLAFEEARRWTSYLPPSSIVLHDTIPGIVAALFARLSLSANHGQVLVERVLGYLGAAKEGLSEDEMLDVLSLDPDVLQDFRQRSPQSPRADRLPVVIWSRLYFDLAPYMGERLTESVSVLTFYHRQLAEVVHTKFLNGQSVVERHRRLAYYFAQSTNNPTNGTQTSSGLRRLAELPYQQTKGELWDALYHTLTDFTFLERKASDLGIIYQRDDKENVITVYNGIYQIQDDIALALGTWSTVPSHVDKQKVISAFAQALNRETAILGRYPHLLWQQVYNRLQWADEEVVEALKDTYKQRSQPGAKPWFRLRTLPHESTALIRTFTGHTEPISACAFSPDGNTILSVSDNYDDNLWLWDAHTGQGRLIQASGRQPACCAFSPDGTTFVIGAKFAFEGDGLLIWDARTAQVLTTLLADSVDVCAFSTDGTLIVAACGNIIHIIETSAYQEVAVIDTGDWGDMPEDKEGEHLTEKRRSEYRMYQNEIHACMFSPDGTFILAANKYGMLRLWNTDTQEERLVISDACAPCALSSDGRTIVATSHGTMALFDVHSGQRLRTLQGCQAVKACVFSPDSKLIATGNSERLVQLWDTRRGNLVSTFYGHTGHVGACAFSPDGMTLVSAGGYHDQTLKLWDIRSQHSISPEVGQRHTDAIHACAYSPDGTTFLTASDDFTLKVWDAQTSTEHTTLTGPQGLVRACTYSPDGSIIAAASFDDTLRLWDAHTGQPLARLPRMSPLIAGGGITEIAYTHDGTVLLTASEDGTVRVRDAHTGRVLSTICLSESSFQTCALSPGSTTVLAGSEDGSLHFADLLPLQEKLARDVNDDADYPETTWRTLRLRAHSDEVLRCAFSPDGLTYLSCSGDRTLKLWAAATGLEIYTLTGHTDKVNDCFYSSDGTFLFSVSNDRTLRMWDRTTGQERATLPLPETLLSLAGHPTQPIILCCGEAGNIYQAELMCTTYDSFIATALQRNDVLNVRCPVCLQSFALANSQLGTVIACPHPRCTGRLRVNPFVTVASTRSVDPLPPYDPLAEEAPWDGTLPPGKANLIELYRIGFPVIEVLHPDEDPEAPYPPQYIEVPIGIALRQPPPGEE